MDLWVEDWGARRREANRRGDVLFFDPWELHPIDSWLQGRLDYQVGGVEMSSEESARELWTCSMHPHITLPHPGKCSICLMDLVELKPGDDDPGLGTGDR